MMTASWEESIFPYWTTSPHDSAQYGNICSSQLAVIIRPGMCRLKIEFGLYFCCGSTFCYRTLKQHALS